MSLDAIQRTYDSIALAAQHLIDLLIKRHQELAQLLGLGLARRSSEAARDAREQTGIREFRAGGRADLQPLLDVTGAARHRISYAGDAALGEAKLLDRLGRFFR